MTSRCVATKFSVLNKPHKYNRAYRANIKSRRFSNKAVLFRFDLKNLLLQIFSYLLEFEGKSKK